MTLRIKEARKMKGLTQEQLAEMLDFEQVTLSTWELGKREPKIETLIKIANICDVTLNFLLGIDDSETITESDLTEDEQEVIEYFRASDKKGKRRILVFAEQQVAQAIEGGMVQFNCSERYKLEASENIKV